MKKRSRQILKNYQMKLDKRLEKKMHKILNFVRLFQLTQHKINNNLLKSFKKIREIKKTKNDIPF